jgi:uncharacterized membrane protein HdeD (DUF308 family)
MLDVLSRNWWTFAARGVAAVIFGILALAMPGIALVVLVFLFGAYALVDGVFALIGAVREAEAHNRWAHLLFVGIFGILVGAITFFFWQITAFALLYLIAAWAVVTGILELVGAFELRRHLPGDLWWVLAGLASIAFGVLLILRPLSGALAVIWIIGIYAIIFGGFLIGLAFRLRGLKRDAVTVPG